MSTPASRLSRLSLQDMPPDTRSTTRDTSHMERRYPPEDDSSSESGTVSDESDTDSEASSLVESPSRLVYRIDHLPETMRSSVRDSFEEPPEIALQKCRLINNTYAFQMTETVTRSVRIHAEGDGSSRLSCTCQQDAPCNHLLWLLDQILQQTLYDHNPNQPLKMTPQGYAEEMGSPFENIAKYHLGILADGLHCQLVTPDLEYDDEVDDYRVQESRELLSSLYEKSPEDYRPDISTEFPNERNILKPNDLEQSMFRMLLDNNHFFHYFRSLSRPTDPINDIFRKLSQRVDHVLRDLDEHSSSNSETSAETPRDVSWAAMHILGTVGLIKSAIYTRESPLEALEAISAARTLVHILDAVVSRNHDAHPGPNRIERNLYLRLIGDRDQEFVIGVLTLIPEAASQFLNTLEVISDKLGIHGAPASYVEKFRSLLGRLRTSSRRPSLKRQQDHESDRTSKRMK